MIAYPAGVRAVFAGGFCLASVAAAGQAPSVGDLSARPGIAVPWPDATGAPAAREDAATSGTVRYSVVVTGLDALKLTPRFHDASVLWKGRNEPANFAQLSRRAAEDSELIDQLLRSIGHYGGRTAVTIAPAVRGAPAGVTLAVDPGPLYHFAEIKLAVPTGGPSALVAAGLGLRVGDPVAATQIATAGDGLKQYLGVRGYPFATIGAPDIVIDHATRTAVLSQTVDPGPFGRFGRVRVVGRSLLTQREVTRLARFKPGDPYTAADLDDLRRALIATGLLGGVTLTLVRAGATPGGVIVDVDVATDVAPLRTVAATAGYSTSQGIRVEASWQHRNLLPPNGAVTFRGVAAEREQLIGAELRRQNWRARDVTLTLNTTLSNSTQDAFTARTLAFGAAIERETNIIWQKQWYFSAGVEGLLSRQRDKSGVGDPVGTYYITALPVSLTYDGSNDLLDPTRGFRLTGRASPELSFHSGTFGYVKLQADGSTYLPLTDRVTIAVRGRLGSIAGASRRNIAPTRRFYAGGGGSVRGFGYQDVGPEDADGDPRGGNSLTEASLEARFRFGDFGIVPFADVGQVYTSTVPQFDSLRIGAGIGARYYTSFGPVRIDIATPVNPRKNDAAVQFYVSIGQAF